ncbi:MAG: DUF4199 domain-containing protein [Bacteroidaceae bacterium]|nr:DUF4199 domain-containing protein [Bacteroidaceae bacterium]
MNNNNEFPYRAYAMEYGTFLGIAWTSVFFLYTASFRTASGFYSTLAFMGFLSLAIIPFIFAWRVKQLQNKGEGLGVLRGCIFSLNLFMFACLFTGACEYAYFAFFDHGALLDCISNMLQAKEMQDIYREAGLNDAYNQMTDIVKQTQRLSAFEMTESLFNANIVVSFFFVLPVGALASLRKR